MKWSMLSLALLVGCASTGGSEVSLSDSDRAAQQAVAAKLKGTIVWSSARLGNHDLFLMNPDGSNVRQITKGDNVDWFPRFSPDGSKILFCRSKKGWVYERDANSDGKWDLWTVTPEGPTRRRWWTTPAGGAGSRTARSSTCAAPRSSGASWPAATRCW
jgi:hypothetical protein